MLPGEADEEVVEGRGYFDRDGAEVQTGAARCQLDLVAGEGDDAAELLAVDQDEGAGRPCRPAPGPRRGGDGGRSPNVRRRRLRGRRGGTGRGR